MDKLISSEKAIAPLAWGLSFGAAARRAAAVGYMQSLGARLPFLLLRQALQTRSRGGIVARGTSPLSWNTPKGFSWIVRRDQYIHSQTSHASTGELSTTAAEDTYFQSERNANYTTLAPFLYFFQTPGRTVPNIERQVYTGEPPRYSSSRAMINLQVDSQGKSHKASVPFGIRQDQGEMHMPGLAGAKRQELKPSAISLARNRISAFTGRPESPAEQALNGSASLFPLFTISSNRKNPLLSAIRLVQKNQAGSIGQGKMSAESAYSETLNTQTMSVIDLLETTHSISASMFNQVSMGTALLTRKPAILSVLMDSIANSLRGEIFSAIKRTDQEIASNPVRTKVEVNSLIQELMDDDRLAQSLVRKIQILMQENRFRSGQVR